MNLMYSKPRWNHVMLELANRAVNLVKFVYSALHLMIAIVVMYQICSVDCGTSPASLTPKSYNTSDGRLCYMCAPGQFWKRDCINTGEVAICQSCEIGFFQTVDNVNKTCQRCTTDCTQENEELIKVCSRTTDSICQCSSGYFKYEGFCKKHKTCAPGEGVTIRGNKDSDTTCDSCLAGKYFSMYESATEGCLPCTRCDVKGLYEMTPCTIKSDAQCVTSRPPDGSHNIGAILGGIFGFLFVIIIPAVFTVWRCKRHRQNSQRTENNPEAGSLLDERGPAASSGSNSNPHPGILQNNESRDDAMDHNESNVAQNSTTQTGPATSSGSNSNPHPGELQNNEFTDDAMVHNESNVAQNSTTQTGPAASSGSNSNPHPGELQNNESRDDAMEHNESNVAQNSTTQTGSAASSGIPSSVLTKLASDLISANWKFFFRDLSVKDSRIQEIETDNKYVREQIYQLLLDLNQKGTLTKRRLRETLESMGRNDLAAEYCEEA